MTLRDDGSYVLEGDQIETAAIAIGNAFPQGTGRSIRAGDLGVMLREYLDTGLPQDPEISTLAAEELVAPITNGALPISPGDVIDLHNALAWELSEAALPVLRRKMALAAEDRAMRTKGHTGGKFEDASATPTDSELEKAKRSAQAELALHLTAAELLLKELER